jgi:hypothetical protein
MTNSQLTKVTVNLTPRSYTALTKVATLTGYTRTDVINRALQLYHHVEEQLADGHKFMIMEPDGKTAQVIKIF